ncbi:ATP-binding protein [Shewanella waksmanii]|uniref:ATP-binding protein n=1 Tax=Shewanella waksmanii TaxID=213783 RepID=UPI00048E8BA7|nr:ATP-binding protein [Shewanella waksmanii]
MASIKRAEAGKNVLYRTIVNIAHFFNITVDYLLESAPLPLWQFASQHPKFVKPCIGRDWECHQLAQLQGLAQHSLQGQTVCVTATAGAGISCLLKYYCQQHAQQATLQASQQSIYIEFSKISTDKDHTACFILQLLALAPNTSDREIRDNVKSLSKSSLQFLILLWLTGVTLTETEQHSIAQLNQPQLDDVIAQATQLLLHHCSEQAAAIIIIDGLQRVDELCLKLVGFFIQAVYSKPILCVLGITEVADFVHLPIWLEHAHQIRLKPLMNDHAKKLAKNLLSQHGVCPIKHANQAQRAIELANGHPGMLEQLLLSHNKLEPLPESILKPILSNLYSLTTEQITLIKYLSILGIKFSIDNIEFFFNQINITNPLSQINQLIYRGLIKPTSGEYCFNHPLIRRVIKEQIKAQEKVALETIYQLSLQ